MLRSARGVLSKTGSVTSGKYDPGEIVSAFATAVTPSVPTICGTVTAPRDTPAASAIATVLRENVLRIFAMDMAKPPKKRSG